MITLRGDRPLYRSHVRGPEQPDPLWLQIATVVGEFVVLVALMVAIPVLVWLAYVASGQPMPR